MKAPKRAAKKAAAKKAAAKKRVMRARRMQDEPECVDFTVCSSAACPDTCGDWIQRGKEAFTSDPADASGAKFQTVVLAWGDATAINFEITSPAPNDTLVLEVHFKTSIPSFALLDFMQRFGFWYLPPLIVPPDIAQLSDGDDVGILYCGKFAHRPDIGPIPVYFCDDPIDRFRCPLECGLNLKAGTSYKIEGFIKGVSPGTVVSGNVVLAGK